MITQETRFDKAKDALLNAFLNDTLRAGDCTACACGNIIAAACGIEVPQAKTMTDVMRTVIKGHLRDDENIAKLRSWADRRHGITIGNKTVFFPLPTLKDYVNEAGYTTEEFSRIENAFEQNTKYKINQYHVLTQDEILQDQFKGLCAVIDVLIDIDKVQVDPQSCYAQFRKKLENA